MELDILDEGHYRIIKIIGDLDASSSIKLDDAIQQAVNLAKLHLLFDCTSLNYISSPGIGVFTSRIEDAEEGGVKMVMFGMTEKVKNVFKILGLDQLLPIVGTREEAKREIDDLHNQD